MDNLCVMCGQPKGKNKFCCSNKCIFAYGKYWKTCIVCGKSFPDQKSNPKICCSPECSRINRQRITKKESTEKMIQARQQFSEEHNGEKDVNSKYWVIQSPAGKIYECQNLRHFIRTNQDLFDGTIQQAMTGFSRIKATAQGKLPKNQTRSWKDWRLISWGDETLAEKMRKEKKKPSFHHQGRKFRVKRKTARKKMSKECTRRILV